MTIECYNWACRFHSTGTANEGPFCFEEQCRATEHELRLLDVIRSIEKIDLEFASKYMEIMTKHVDVRRGYTTPESKGITESKLNLKIVGSSSCKPSQEHST